MSTATRIVGGRRVVAEAVGGFALTLAATAPLGACYSAPAWWAPVIGTVLVAVLVAGPLGIWRRDAVTVVLTALLGAIAVGVVMAAPSAVSAGGGAAQVARTLVDDVWQAWARLLTAGLPARPAAVLLVAPVMAVWTVGVVTTVTALRSTTALAPAAAPLGWFVVALLLAGSQPTRQLAATGAFIGLALLVVGLHAAGEEGESLSSAADGGQVAPADLRPFGPGGRRLRRVAQAGVVVGSLAAITAIGLVAALAVPDRDRFDPRTLRDPAVDARTRVSPLLALKSELTTTPAHTVLTATVRPTAFKDTLRLRTATLEDFDGVVWTSHGSFVEPPARLPVAEQAGRRGMVVTLDVHVADLPDTLLPAAGQPLALRAAGAKVDPGSAAIALWRSNGDTPAGYRYQVSGWVPVQDVDIRRALVDASGGARRALALPPGVPDGLRTLTGGLARTASSPYQWMKNLEDYLRRLPYGESAAPGESYAVVGRAAMQRPSKTLSFAEQRAAAFVVMARILKVPARIAVGYVVDVKDAAKGEITVTTAQAHAWPEVRFAGYGWVPFEPTDRSVVRDASANPAGGYRPDHGLGAPTVTAALAPSPDAAAAGRRWWLWTPVSAIVLAVGGAVAVVAGKRTRRRRRRHASRASARIVGAWSEAVDRLVEAGLGLRWSLSPGEVADAAGTAFGGGAGRPLLAMSVLVEEAVYAPWQPGEASVAEAWHGERDVARAVLALQPRVLRWRRHVDPRPLLRRRPTAGPSRRRPS